MAVLVITLIVPDEEDPQLLARSIYNNCFNPVSPGVVRLTHFDYRLPHKQAMHTIAIVCDTCGDLVDKIKDPFFRQHNHDNYDRHVKITHEDPDYPNVARIF